MLTKKAWKNCGYLFDLMDLNRFSDDFDKVEQAFDGGQGLDVDKVFQGIMELAKIYPLHCSKIIESTEKHFKLCEDQKKKLTELAATEENRINRYFTKYEEFLHDRNETFDSEVKEIILSAAHYKEIKK